MWLLHTTHDYSTLHMTTPHRFSEQRCKSVVCHTQVPDSQTSTTGLWPAVTKDKVRRFIQTWLTELCQIRVRSIFSNLAGHTPKIRTRVNGVLVINIMESRFNRHTSGLGGYSLNDNPGRSSCVGSAFLNPARHTPDCKIVGFTGQRSTGWISIYRTLV